MQKKQNKQTKHESVMLVFDLVRIVRFDNLSVTATGNRYFSWFNNHIFKTSI